MNTKESLNQHKRTLIGAAKLVSRRAMTVGRHAGIDGSSEFDVPGEIRRAFEEAYKEYEEEIDLVFKAIEIGQTP